MYTEILAKIRELIGEAETLEAEALLDELVEFVEDLQDDERGDK